VSGGPAPLPAWDELDGKVPGITGPMRRYLEQIGCVLRPRSVVNADMALRCFAGFLAAAAPEPLPDWPTSTRTSSATRWPPRQSTAE
jgi:hypothetical protein